MKLTDEQIEKAALRVFTECYGFPETDFTATWVHPHSKVGKAQAEARAHAHAALEAVMPGEPVAWGEIVNIASRAKHNGDCGGGYNFVGKDAAASALMELRASGYEIIKAAPARPTPGPEAEMTGHALWQAFLGGYACGMDHDYSGPPFEDAAREAWEQERGSYPAPEPGELEPDYCFNPEGWDSTHNWDTRDQVHCWGDAIPGIGDMMEVHTLIEGPAYWVARVPVSYTEDGDVDETTYEWFRSKEEARAALAEGGCDE